MTQQDIVIGETYRIRQWEDMKREFGLNAHGEIRDPEGKANFIQAMAHLCGDPYTVKSKEMDSACGEFEIRPFMLEPLNPVHPAIKIGKFTIRRHDDNSLWLMHESGTGGVFVNAVVESALQEILNRYH